MVTDTDIHDESEKEIISRLDAEFIDVPTRQSNSIPKD